VIKNQKDFFGEKFAKKNFDQINSKKFSLRNFVFRWEISHLFATPKVRMKKKSRFNFGKSKKNHA